MSRHSWTTWTPLILLPAIVMPAVPAAWPRWALMWLLAFAIYAGCKWLTWNATPAPAAAWTRHLGYLLAWPGMDAPAFLGQRQSTRPRLGEWLFAAAKFVLGVALLFGLARLVPCEHPYFAGWIGMIGLILALHFGSFHLLSCAWRSGGVIARPLMDWPLCSPSLAEFWGRRWNTAFRDLTHRFLFRPLTGRIGPRRAVFAGFALSGLVHDLVISLPAGGGYGGPTLFFLLQGSALLCERSTAGRRAGLGRGWTGRLFTAAVVLLPVPLLFHPPFIERIALPFLQSIGAI